jgi:trans-aconitate 2-methyltransferase
MLAQAKKAGIAAQWLQADVAAWRAAAPYGVIFSNATYQWLGDHAALLPRLIGFVMPGGSFAFQVPRNMDAPSHALMRETAANGAWSAKLRNVREIAVLAPVAYYDILKPHAASVDIWETEYLHVLTGADAVYHWVSATGLRPFVQALDGGERDAFIAAYKARLNLAYPPRADGTTLFAFKRLFVVARR